MNGRKLRILFCRTSIPETTSTAHGFYYEKVLRRHHDVVTYGPNLPESMYEPLNFVQINKPVEADIPYFTDSLADVLGRLPWTPDLLLWTDNLYWFLMKGLRTMPCPTACFLLDPQYLSDLKIEMARHFDHVFVSQKTEVETYKTHGVKNVYWLTHACDPDIHGKKDVGKIHDICFVGTLNPKRIEMLNKLRERFAVHYEQCFGTRMAEVYSQSKIIFNTSTVNEINMRVFEAMASGSLLLTDAAPGSGLPELFEDRRHLVFYRNDEEMVALADYYLTNGEERERIAETGMKEVLKNHTYACRVERMLQIAVSAGNERCRRVERQRAVTGKMPVDQRIAVFQQLVRHHPDHGEAYFNLGILYQDKGRIDDAIDCYSKALQILPENAHIHNNLGVSYKSKGEPDLAISQFSKAVAFDPDYADAYFNLGNVLQQMAVFPQAITCYEKVLQIDPRHASAYNNLATLYRIIGQFDRHMEYFQKALHYMD